jgi:hypothetical protein
MMKFKVKTSAQIIAYEREWRPTFLILPRKVAEDDVRWLEMAEARTILRGKFPNHYALTQYRAKGSNGDGWPRTPMPPVAKPKKD